MTVTIDNSIFDKLKAKTVDAGEQVVAAVAQAQIASEQLRLKKGFGTDDNRMPAYSKGYAKFKANAGRQVQARDLLFSGKLRRSRHATAPKKNSEGYETTITFSDQHSKVIALANQRIAPAFGVSPQDREKIDAVAQTAIMNALTK